MIEIEQIVKEVANKLNVDREIVNTVCRHIFDYTADIMLDETDTRDILFNQLFKFKLKRRFKDDKTKKCSPR